MSKSGRRIIDGLHEASEIARKAAEVAFIIQEAREEDASATRTAYRILGHLGIITYHEPQPAAEPADVGECQLTKG